MASAAPGLWEKKSQCFQQAAGSLLSTRAGFRCTGFRCANCKECLSRKVLQITSADQIIWCILKYSFTLSKKKSNAEGWIWPGWGILAKGKLAEVGLTMIHPIIHKISYFENKNYHQVFISESKTQRDGLHFDIRTMQSTYTPKMRYWTSVSLLLYVENLGRKTLFSCAFCSILPRINHLRGVVINLHSKLNHLPLNTIPCCPKLLKYAPVSFIKHPVLLLVYKDEVPNISSYRTDFHQRYWMKREQSLAQRMNASSIQKPRKGPY